MRNLFTTLTTVALLLQGSPIAFAEIFPDVPDGYIYQDPIEALVAAQVINGNPDGTFDPERGVNRAEMLKMLYKAKGKTPDAASKNCFPDVDAGSWYESFVCDAAANRFVQGYSDGTFRPATLVNRVEAIKMIAEVFGINILDITEENRDIIKFVDVSTASWYTKYLYSAFEMGILPIQGQVGARFYPDWPLLRGEAAAYIYNSLHIQPHEEREDPEDQLGNDEDLDGQPDATADDDVQDEEPDAGIQVLDFPFNVSGKFAGKKVKAYKFSLVTSKVVSIVTSLQSGQSGKLSCRLYKMKDSGFSTEYYLGYQTGTKCYLLAALNPGEYQLEIQPTVNDTTYDIVSEETTGDGNDGFSQAKPFTIGLTKTDVLGANDLQDWYKFSLSSEKNLWLDASDSAEITCIIYAMDDVDLYGFSGPQCNQSYTYPEGTYYISIGRKAPRASTQTYTIQLR
ncbi:S-layer homology domain-containing protein [Patescibacteria group bacterium]|nr:S-layer homology domain-containing protein [Patescibacteria group bacterium]MBU1124082.1 S-layer homology domain-containing protein [Patescibacteria group bacterium]MBU1911542.1 S-layer homology domain-containing protein [Patescibacteria group bacterium]